MIPKHKSPKTKKPILTLVLLSVLFYGVMLLLTLFAKDIHDARLPKVTASRLGKQPFTYTVTLEDGSTMERTSNTIAIPKELVDSGQVFTIRTVAENGMTFYYAMRATISIDASMQNDDYYAPTFLGFNSEMYILSGYENLEDGDEVYLVKEKKE